MDNIKLGNLIKDLRIKRNLTQKNLAMNICTRKQIIRLEKGEFSPSIYTLHLLSKRLGTDILDYYEYLLYDNPIAVYDFFNLLNKEYYMRNESYIETLLQDDLVASITSKEHKKLLFWYKCICDAQLYGRFEENLKSLTDLLIDYYDYSGSLLDLTQEFLHPFDYRIIASIGSMYANLNDYISGINLLLPTINKLVNDYKFEDPQILTPLLFNLSKYLYRENDYLKSLHYLFMGERLLVKYDIFLGLGDFHVQIADCYEALNERENALKYYKKYAYYLDTYKNTEKLNRLKEYLVKNYSVLI